MKLLVGKFIHQIKDAISIGENAELTKNKKTISNVLIIGLGGSGIGGKIATQLFRNKVKNIESLNPQVISSGNIGCITQIANGTNIPILHTVELLDWYTGGPKPKILKEIWKKF